MSVDRLIILGCPVSVMALRTPPHKATPSLTLIVADLMPNGVAEVANPIQQLT